jgi:hypothetical protein
MTSKESAMPTLQLSLTRGDVFRPRRATSVRVLKGRLWLTQRGVLDDVFLEPGDAMVLTPTTSMVVEAIDGPALMTLEKTGPARVISRCTESLAAHASSIQQLMDSPWNPARG